MKFVHIKTHPLQVAAQVEITGATKISAATSEHMDSSQSASPTTTWNSRKQAPTNNNMREIDQARGRSEGSFAYFPFYSFTVLFYIFHFSKMIFFSMEKNFHWIRFFCIYLSSNYDFVVHFEEIWFRSCRNIIWFQFSSVSYIAWDYLQLICSLFIWFSFRLRKKSSQLVCPYEFHSSI